MKIVTSSEMKKAELTTCKKQGIASFELMEKAGNEVFKFILNRLLPTKESKILVCSGEGNNGGDGLVVYRLLKEEGYQVDLYNLAEDSWQNFIERQFPKYSIIVDALLGTGLKGETLKGDYKQIIQWINSFKKHSKAKIISIDMPSGIVADSAKVMDAAVNADFTTCIQFPKYGNIFFPGTKFCGEQYLIEIGISFSELDNIFLELIDSEVVKTILENKLIYSDNVHKGNKGTVLCVGGTEMMCGAVVLSALAANKAGAGKVFVASLCEKSFFYFSRFPHLLGLELKNYEIQLKELMPQLDSIIVGPGLGVTRDSTELLMFLLKEANSNNIPVILDADALNIISKNKEFISLIKNFYILTPHLKEASRLLELSIDQIKLNKISAIKKLQELTGGQIVLKGARSLLFSGQDKVTVNTAANSALATAGSGDVLSGILGAFVGQGMTSKEAMLSAVHIHGLLATHFCKQYNGPIGSDAEALLNLIPLTINSFISQAEAKNKNILKKILSKVS